MIRRHPVPALERLAEITGVGEAQTPRHFRHREPFLAQPDGGEEALAGDDLDIRGGKVAALRILGYFEKVD